MNSFRHMVTCGVSVHVAFREVNGICQAQTPRFFRSAVAVSWMRCAENARRLWLLKWSCDARRAEVPPI